MSHILEVIYREHHCRQERHGFIFGEKIRANLFADFIGKGKVILDLGCRDGSLTSFYNTGNQVCGVDIDSYSLRLCQDGLKIPVLQCNLNEPLPFKDASFDVVIAGEVLEHVFYPWILVREIYRVLKPGGIFVGSVPNSYHWRKRVRFLLGKELGEDITHLHFFSIRNLKRLLMNEAFTEIHVVPWILNPRLKIVKSFMVKFLPGLFSSGFIFRARKES